MHSLSTAHAVFSLQSDLTLSFAQLFKQILSTEISYLSSMKIQGLVGILESLKKDY